MKVELDTDEVWALMSLVVARVADEAGLPKDDKAKLRRWRSEVMRPDDEPIRVLARKINKDLTDAARRKERSQIRRPDWR